MHGMRMYGSRTSRAVVVVVSSTRWPQCVGRRCTRFCLDMGTSPNTWLLIAVADEVYFVEPRIWSLPGRLAFPPPLSQPVHLGGRHLRGQQPPAQEVRGRGRGQEAPLAPLEGETEEEGRATPAAAATTTWERQRSPGNVVITHVRSQTQRWGRTDRQHREVPKL